MKLFTIDKNEKLSPYKERVFKDSNQEADLEVLLEKNPEYFFEESKVLIIGSQVTTNLIEFYRTHLENLGYFTNAKSNLKWVIDKSYSEEDVKRFFDVLENIILKIKEKGLK